MSLTAGIGLKEQGGPAGMAQITNARKAWKPSLGLLSKYFHTWGVEACREYQLFERLLVGIRTEIFF